MNPLHRAIGTILRSGAFPHVDVLLDPACGGEEHIRFYGKEPPGQNTCIVWVDAAIILNGEIKVVIEIEESDIRPIHLCGKVLATAVSRYYSGRRGRLPISTSLMFLQAFVKRSDRANWSKINQCRYLAKEFDQLLGNCQSRIAYYSPHFGTAEEFSTPEHRDAVVMDINAFLDGNWQSTKRYYPNFDVG